MSNSENAVRAAAQALHLAITNAKSAGQVVIWPRNADGLLSISISDTANSLAAKPPVKPKRATKPKTIGTDKSN